MSNNKLGNEKFDGDVFMPGAFKKSIDEKFNGGNYLSISYLKSHRITSDQLNEFYQEFIFKYGLQRNENEVLVQQARNNKYIEAHKMHVKGFSFADINRAIFDPKKYVYTRGIILSMNRKIILHGMKFIKSS